MMIYYTNRKYGYLLIINILLAIPTSQPTNPENSYNIKEVEIVSRLTNISTRLSELKSAFSNSLLTTNSAISNRGNLLNRLTTYIGKTFKEIKVNEL